MTELDARDLASLLYPSMTLTRDDVEDALPADEQAALKEQYPTMFEAPQEATAPPARPRGAAAPTADEELASKLYDSMVASPATLADVQLPPGTDPSHPLTQDFVALASEQGFDTKTTERLIAMRDRAVEAHVEQVLAVEAKRMITATRRDPEIGGSRFEESVAGARGVLERYGSPELHELLRDSRLGNHPEVVRLLYRVSKALSGHDRSWRRETR